MARPARLTKAEMVEKLEAVFKENGYEGASLKLLSDVTGLSKASLYHHFPKGKEEMAAHVLAHSGAHLQKLVLAPLSEKSAAGLQASFGGVARYYGGAVPICLMNSLLLGEGRALFGNQIGQAVAAWRKGIADCLLAEGANKPDAEAWAMDAIQRIQGALVLCRVTLSRDPLEASLSALKQDLTEWLEAD